MEIVKVVRGLGWCEKIFELRPHITIWALVLGGCAGYVPGQQAYWDAHIREMCAKDGGVHIYERVVVSVAQLNEVPKIAGYFGVAPEALAKPEEPAFTRYKRVPIQEGNPSVARHEREIIRRSDGRVVGLVISYGRGGDFPSPAHPSTFSCPDSMDLYKGISELYEVEVTK